MSFPPKKDLLCGILVWGAAMFLILVVIRGRSYLTLLGIIPMLFFLGLIWFRTRYTIKDDALEITFGILHQEIPFSKIIRVKPTRNFWSSFALSLDRIEITYRYGKSYISPLDSTAFNKELKQRCPQAEFLES